MLLSCPARAGVRDVQIREVDTAARIITLHNFGATSQSLNGFRFCTADSDQVLRYTSATGLNGFTLGPGGALNVHLDNDAPPLDPDSVNVSQLGGFFAGPLGNGPFGLALYWTTPFSIGANMADYVQWTDALNNPQNLTADERADEAVTGGVWTAADAWVVTTPDTTRITLLDDTGQELHGPADYEATGDVEPCLADCGDGNGTVDIIDLLEVLSQWGAGGSPGCDIAPDGGDGTVDILDLLDVLAAWGDCP
jgi:hypothetical protein